MSIVNPGGGSTFPTLIAPNGTSYVIGVDAIGGLTTTPSAATSLLLQAPNGTLWVLSVDNLGGLVTDPL